MVMKAIEQREGWFWPADDQGCWNTQSSNPNLPDKLAAHCRQHRTAFQAGGNCGVYIKRFAELFDAVYTCEPDVTNFVCLTLNTRDKDNVYRYQCGIGKDHEGIALDTFNNDAGAVHVSGKGNIPVILIDDLNLQNVDLIAIDIEGFEYNALLGAKETLAKWKPTLVIEWYQPWADRYGFTLEATEKFLDQFGYKYVTNYESDRVYVAE
jgi:FkbM family methyltransferase